MAETTNTPSSEDIWNLNIEDLLAPLPEKSRLGGPGPFVINLSASYAPIDLPAKGIAGFGNTHVYQMQRIEDGRPRYRLRLGSFANEDEADAALPKVRDIYPSALTATADADDLRTIAALRAKAAASQPIAERSAEKPAEKPMVKAVVEAAVKPAAPLTLAAAKAPSAAPAVPVAPRLITPQQKAAVLAPAPALARAPVSAPAPISAPMPVLARVPSPATALAPAPVLSRATAPASALAPTPVLARATAPATALTPTPVLSRVPSPVTALAPMPVLSRATAPATALAPTPALGRAPVSAPAPISAPASREVDLLSKGAPSIESTQTIRALTQLELEDDQASSWFAIQLSLSEEPFDPETLPNLDIFSVYRLYSVAGIDNGRIVHALRLGFFTEQIAAGAVASYLTAFYDKPAIKRVSAAERERFADQSLQARKDVGATGKQAVIEITNERYIREKRVGQGAGKSAV
jgi:SPOR domain